MMTPTRYTRAFLRSKLTLLPVILTAIAAQFALQAPAFAQDEPTPTDGMVLPDASITTRADATSLELNPAGLGFLQGGQFALGLQRADADYEGVAQRGVGAFLAGGNGTLGAGFGVEWLNRPDLGVTASDYRKYVLGLALSSDANLSFGTAFNFFGSSQNEVLDQLTSWDVGLMWRPSENLGFGVHVRDLNQPFFPGLGQTADGGATFDEPAGEALPVRVALGAALRFWDGRAVLDPAVAFTSNGDSLYLRPRILIEPYQGIQLFARTEFDFEFNGTQSTTTWNQSVAGLALNVDGLGVESAVLAHLDGDAGVRGSTHLLWLGSQRERNLFERDRRWVLVNLTGQIDEQPSSGLFMPTIHSFMSLVVKLEQLAGDDTIEGVVFNVGKSGLGYAQLWEVRQAIENLRQAGKKTVSVLTNPTFRETYLASGADALWLIPPEPYHPDGLSMTMTSYAQTLAKAGVQAEFMRIGRYKSAPESYTYETPSEESIEQRTAYLDGLYGRVTGAIAADRGLSAEKVTEMIDQVPLFPADAVKRGFADNVIYLDVIQERLREKFGPHVHLEKDYPAPTAADMRWGSRPEIAVVVISGMIVRGQSGRTPFLNETVTGSDSLADTFGRLRRDPNVRAVVVRIDSPGGSAVASDLIFRELRRLAEEKPVVASMSNIAASGGYYAAAGADEIFATPNTLTGSIGIFAGKFSISKLADLIGINVTKLQRGARSGSFSLFEPWSDTQREGIARSISYLYKLFIQQVSRTRPLSPEEVDAVARGHIWDGESARSRKLVDQIGGLTDALHRAEALANLSPDQKVDYHLYPKSLGLFNAGAASLKSSGIDALFASVFDPQSASTHWSADSALGSLIRHIGRGILMPLLYADAEALMLLPFVVEAP